MREQDDTLTVHMVATLRPVIQAFRQAAPAVESFNMRLRRWQLRAFSSMRPYLTGEREMTPGAFRRAGMTPDMYRRAQQDLRDHIMRVNAGNRRRQERRRR